MSVLSRYTSRFGQRSMFVRILLMASIPLVLIAIAAYLYLTAGRSASTDDAYVQADKIVVSSDVSARVVAVEVKDNQPVKAGQVLIRLDDSAATRSRSPRRKPILPRPSCRSTGCARPTSSAQADVKAAQDTLDYMQREADRQAQLLATHITSQQKYDEARHNLDAARQSAFLGAAAARQCAGEPRRQSRHPDRSASAGDAGQGASRSGGARSLATR